MPVPSAPAFYWRSELSAALGVSLGIEGWASEGPVYSGEFPFEILVVSTSSAGLARSAAVELYVGAGFHSTYAFAPVRGWAVTPTQ